MCCWSPSIRHIFQNVPSVPAQRLIETEIYTCQDETFLFLQTWFEHIVYSLASRQGLFPYMLERAKPDLMQQPSSWLLYHLCSVLLFHHSLTTCSIMFKHGCWFIMMVPTMNSLFQHAWPSLSTTMFKLASSTMFKPVNRQKQAVRFYVCIWYPVLTWRFNCYLFVFQN